MKFDKYPFAAEIKQSVEEAGFVKPTDIQYKAIPAILRKEDVLAIAQTGTGKTAAFALPIVQMLFSQLKYSEYIDLKCLVMVPTHELALQIAEVFRQFAKHTP